MPPEPGPTKLPLSALIISPFATWPLDAGHRRRTYQMTRLLKDAGFHITFILFAFEEHWHCSHDEAIVESLRGQWNEVHVVYAHHGVGLKPKQGTNHHLDEWWDPDLEAALRNISSRRTFDVAVVHNVWLSKAFDFLPPRTIRVLETHDIFWNRPEAFRRIGREQEFFVCSKPAEIFGIRRSHVAIAIQPKDGAELLAATSVDVVSVPFYDAALETEASALKRRDYLAPDKVSFGFLASANAFNIAGLTALVRELERLVGETFAPVELVIGGRVGEHVESPLHMRKLGFVPSEAEFYAQVDYAIAPVFDGTGFKIKTADALALDMPSLFSTHAAEGTSLDRSVQFATPAAMADRMVELSLRRPPIAETRVHVTGARAGLRTAAESGARQFVKRLHARLNPLAIDLSSANPVSDVLVLQSFLSVVRILSEKAKVFLILSPAAIRIFGRVLPPGVQAATLEEFDDWLKGENRPPVALLDVLGRSRRLAERLRPNDRFLRDQRWSAPGGPEAEGVFDAMPVFHSNISWEPAALALRKAFPSSAVAPFLERAPLQPLVFAAGDLPAAAGHAPGRGSQASMIYVRADHWTTLQNACMSLHLRQPREVVWAGDTRGVAFRAILESCALLRIPFHGPLDEAFWHEGHLPQRFVLEQDKLAHATADQTLRRPNG